MPTRPLPESVVRLTNKFRRLKSALKIQSAVRRRQRVRKALPKPAKKQVTSIVKREISRQTETMMNWGRLLYQEPQTALLSMEGAQYWLGNLGGVIAINDQTITPMKLINAIPINQNVAAGLSPWNQSYSGRSIFGKTMQTKINLVMPSLRSIPVGGADWQTMPQNLQYRMLIFKTKNQPAINTAAAGFTNAPFCLNGFQNEVGSTFGVSSADSEALPDPTGAPGTIKFVNKDLMTAKFNTMNFTKLYEKRGYISPASSLNATSNPSVTTQGSRQYPSEVNFSYTHKINKKLNLQLESETGQTTPGVAGTSRITNYDTSICFFLALCPVAPGKPGQLNDAATQNASLAALPNPYVNISSRFFFTDS